jgi:hypothetical protein
MLLSVQPIPPGDLAAGPTMLDDGARWNPQEIEIDKALKAKTCETEKGRERP